MAHINDPRLLKANRNGVTEWFHFDDAEGVFRVEQTQDMHPILDDNQYAQLNIKRDWGGDLHHIGRVPLVVAEELRKQGILDEEDPDRPRLKAWLNDPANRCFRTKLGKV